MLLEQKVSKKIIGYEVVKMCHPQDDQQLTLGGKPMKGRGQTKLIRAKKRKQTLSITFRQTTQGMNLCRIRVGPKLALRELSRREKDNFMFPFVCDHHKNVLSEDVE